MPVFRLLPLLFLSASIFAQQPKWQQRVFYQMDIDFNVKDHQFDGKQRLVYQNNSPDTLRRVFYHLYFNAFQPGSMMDTRSRTIPDPDPRVGDRIFGLKENETGFLKIRMLRMNGDPVNFEVEGTILEAVLPQPLYPGRSAIFDMDFIGQVPVQIRRSGRNNKEGIDYSMSQWYPKMAEYDQMGWHANPYVGREFHGIWGDFDVRISIDRNYIIGATGYLQNPEEIGYGYEKKGVKVRRPEGKKLTWRFIAPNVHDFVWAADPDYTHDKLEREDGVVLHFLYQKNERTEEIWKNFPRVADKAMDYVNVTYGKYPYKQYSFIQGGDGGMEYPMATLITAERSFGSLVGTGIHELMHSWYQGILATNESLYSWMDEGFTNFTEAEVINHLRKTGVLPGKENEDPHRAAYTGYRNLVKSGLEEPMTTHADHFLTNYAYSMATYTKGEVFLAQLRYIIGKEAFDLGMLRYFSDHKFRHPDVNDFIRVMEKVAGIELDWYRDYWTETTHVIDYAVSDVREGPEGNSLISLSRIGAMPMPVELEIEFKDGNIQRLYVPLVIMRGQKKDFSSEMECIQLPDWPWTHPVYILEIDHSPGDIERISLDPDNQTADVVPENNIWLSTTENRN